ncbi:MAG: GNAT family N-acetyltransferase [Chitinispirillaceae bacterium]|nr:GNAT family N-acetyltransferase [Chitinispirillaceae bacterium]
MENVHIRPLIDTDFDGCMDLYRYLHAEDDPPPPPETLHAVWNALISDPQTICLGAFTGERMVAVCNAQVVRNLTRAARPYAVVENVVTHPDFRRRGIGRDLLMELISRCDQFDCYKIMLMSASRRTEAHAFYRSIGFDDSAKRAFVLSRRDLLRAQ